MAQDDGLATREREKRVPRPTLSQPPACIYLLNDGELAVSQPVELIDLARNVDVVDGGWIDRLERSSGKHDRLVFGDR